MALVAKNPPANAGDVKRLGFNPWVGNIPSRRAEQPTPTFLPENGRDRAAWEAQPVVSESDLTGHTCRACSLWAHGGVRHGSVTRQHVTCGCLLFR